MQMQQQHPENLGETGRGETMKETRKCVQTHAHTQRPPLPCVLLLCCCSFPPSRLAPIFGVGCDGWADEELAAGLTAASDDLRTATRGHAPPPPPLAVIDRVGLITRITHRPHPHTHRQTGQQQQPWSRRLRRHRRRRLQVRPLCPLSVARLLSKEGSSKRSSVSCVCRNTPHTLC